MANEYSKKKTIKCKNCELSFLPILLVDGEKIKCRFNVCPNCGNLLPKTINYIRNYFEIIQLSKELDKAKGLFLKSELVSAVREAVIKFEDIVREKSGLKDLKGSDLMGKAFSFKFDQNKNIIAEEPKIKVNNLSNVAKRNEQEGIKFIAMGLMQGIRNFYVHYEGNERLFYCLEIMTLINLLLKQIMGEESIASRLK
ncbi:MAG: TIGR02391 family protein [Thermodesulfobacteriota bacterium]